MNLFKVDFSNGQHIKIHAKDMERAKEIARGTAYGMLYDRYRLEYRITSLGACINGFVQRPLDS